MKTLTKSFLSLLALAGLLFAFSSCAVEGGGSVGYVETGVYYGPYERPWFDDGVWIDGRYRYREPRTHGNPGPYIHPPRPPARPPGTHPPSPPHGNPPPHPPGGSGGDRRHH